MLKEIELYLTNNYYFLLKISKKYTKNDEWATELLHEIIIQLYDKKEYKLNLDDESIKSYIIRMLMVNWCFPSSPFYRKFKKHNLTHVQLNEAIHLTHEETELDNHKLLDIIENEWTHVDWFNKLIFEKYMVMGSLKKVATDTTIPLTSIKRYVDTTKKLIKHNTFKRFENE